MKKNKTAIKAQERRIKALVEQEKQEKSLLDNRREINDLEYKIDKTKKNRRKILESPINEHSSEIELTGEDFDKKYPHLCPICGGENPKNITEGDKIICNLCNCTVATVAADYDMPTRSKKQDSSEYEWNCPLDGTGKDEEEEPGQVYPFAPPVVPWGSTCSGVGEPPVYTISGHFTLPSDEEIKIMAIGKRAADRYSEFQKGKGF